MARSFEHMRVLTLVLGELENDAWGSTGARESEALFQCGTALSMDLLPRG